ncbi:hypothetical protein [Aneurinibacillus aneurinilyticus]|uniref:hypothetical protein n=1 Tax=Aneurinibacillus aneurinilyticus TaxID=1391 RepID=UPI003671CF7E
MYIREWYGGMKDMVSINETDKCFDELLVLYAKAISMYFSLSQVTDANKLIELASKQELEVGQKLFLDWFQEKGLPYLKKITSKRLPDNEQLIAQIEYDKYILEDEMDFDDPVGVRACLINIVNNLPYRIQNAEVEGAAAKEPMPKSSALSVRFEDAFIIEKNYITSKVKQEKINSSTKIKESVEKQALFLLCNIRGIKMDFETYKIMRNHTRLVDVELVSMECEKNDTNQDEVDITLRIQRGINIVNSKEADIFLRTVVSTEKEESPFSFDIVYKGKCISIGELSDNDFKEYAYAQIVPLLLPYARECIASTMARMKLTVYTIPTIDVLQTLEVNDGSAEQE